MGATYRPPPILRPPALDPDVILADALAWCDREQRILKEGLLVLSGDMDACLCVALRHRTYSNFAAGKADHGRLWS